MKRHPKHSLPVILRRFSGNAEGAVAILFALLSIPLLVLAGIVIDYAANSMAQQTVQDASDAAVLSLLKLPIATKDSDLQAKADEQVRASLTKLTLDDLIVTMTRIENTIKITVVGSTRTSLTRIAGYNSLPINVTSSGMRGSGNLEIALVLDNTGSMRGSKIADLKTAATDLVAAMFAEADPNKPNSLKIGIVPFSMTVNVGPTNSSQNWIDKNAQASTHSQIFSASANRLTLFQKLGVIWGGCVESRVAPYDIEDTAPTTANPDTLFVPYFAPDESDKEYEDSYTMNNNYMGDDLSSNDNRARLKRLSKYTSNKIVRFGRINGVGTNYLYGPNSGCELQPITRLTTTRKTLDDAIAAMTVIGDTNIPMGLVWGWHVLSPNAPFAEGVAYGDKKTRKFIVLMTDGQNQSATRPNNTSQSYYSGIGFIWQNRIGTVSNDLDTRRAALDGRLTALCKAIKDAQITIFTVRVEVTEGSSDVLSQCATDEDKFYDVKDSSSLTAAFKAIGSQISELRISR